VHRRALLAALCVTLPLRVHGQAPSAEAFLRDLYAPYLTGANQGQNYWDLERYFAPDLARLMDAEARDAQRRNEVPRLDGDPFVDAQDWDVKNFALSVKTDGSNATAIVTFDNYGKAKRITLDLVLTHAGWRVSDVKAPSGSLRALYK
jgi:hypothetical protein